MRRKEEEKEKTVERGSVRLYDTLDRGYLNKTKIDGYKELQPAIVGRYLGHSLHTSPSGTTTTPAGHSLHTSASGTTTTPTRNQFG